MNCRTDQAVPRLPRIETRQVRRLRCGGTGYAVAMTTLVIIAAVVATMTAVGWFTLQRQHPERAAGHAPPDTTSTAQRRYETADRPAGPGAETMDPDQLGGDHRPPT